MLMYLEDTHRIRMDPDDYVLQTFIEDTTGRAMCRLGVRKNSSSKTVSLGYKFLMQSKTFFDNKGGKIAFSKFSNYNFWTDEFDWELAAVGLFCVVCLLVIIAYFAYVRNRNLKQLEADKREEDSRLTSDSSSWG